MSDQPQGEGWWLASDGKWYPPPRPDIPAQPATVPTAAEPPEKSGPRWGLIAGIALAVVVLAGAVAFFVTRDGDKGAPSGFKVIEDDKSGVSIAVPNDFHEIDPARFADTESQSDFSSDNPDLAPFLNSGNVFLKNSVLAASGSVDGTPAIVVVGKSPQRIDPTDSDFASVLQSEIESQLATLGDSDIRTDTVSLPAGEALRVQVTLDIDKGTSSTTVHETIYFVTVGRTTWAILGVAVGEPATDVFAQIAETFAVKS